MKPITLKQPLIPEQSNLIYWSDWRNQLQGCISPKMQEIVQACNATCSYKSFPQFVFTNNMFSAFFIYIIWTLAFLHD